MQNLTNNKKFKICFLSQEFSKNCNGGVCRYTYDLAHELAKSGNEVHVITRSKNNSEYEYKDIKVFVHKIVPESIDFLELSQDMNISRKNLSYSYSACLKLLKLIDKFDIQIVESPLWDAEGFVFSLINNIPLVVRIETPLFKVAEIQGWTITKDLKFANWMEGEAARRANRIIAISKDIGTLIGNHHTIPKKMIELCPLGIELPDENQLMNNIQNGNSNALFVGRLEKRKGIETLFKAIPLILEEVPNTQFYIVGRDTNLAPNGGSYKEYLLKKLDQKYQGNIEFIGYVDNTNLNNYYKNCDIFIAPSLYESFGLIFLEAMAWGKPVIGCNVGGIPDIVENNEDGLLIEPENKNELANAVLKLLRNKELRKKMGTSGRKKVEADFSTKKMAENSYEIYKNIISSQNRNESIKIKEHEINAISNIRNENEEICYIKTKLTADFLKKMAEKQTQMSFQDAFDRFVGAYKLLNFFDNKLNFKNKVVLDVGCGTGNGALALTKKGTLKVVGIDINFEDFGYNYFNEMAKLLEVSTDNMKFIKGNICDEHIFESENFDIVVAIDSFEHISNPGKALKNCNDFLKPDGYLVIDIGPLYYSPIGHHLWGYFPKETEPWAHLRYKDISKVKDISDWSLDHFNNLNKLTVGEIRSYIKSLNLEIIHENIGRCGKDMYKQYAAEIDHYIVPNKEDLFMESVTYVLKKR